MFQVKATKESTNLISYANLTIYVNDFNEFAPIFAKSLYTKVLNNPENYQIGNIITTVSATDLDGSDKTLVYSIDGWHQEK